MLLDVNFFVFKILIMYFIDFQQDRLKKSEDEYNDELESFMDEFDSERYKR